jgi:hypothetical protein
MKVIGESVYKKLLIGCIIAICILVGISFTSVVGYRSVASDVNASPLFNIRSSRAIDEECGELSCEFVGKGDTIDLIIPDKDEKTALIQEVIDRISKMDDITFNNFINFIIVKLQKINGLKDLNRNKVINFLYQLRCHSQKIDVDVPWIATPTLCWFPGCLIVGMILVIGGILIW